MSVTARDAAGLYELLRGSGIRCWVMGGWGVDALLEEQTREHHNRPLDVAGKTWPTAFVAATEAGVELDVHVIKVDAGVAIPLCDVPWPFDDHSLDGSGVIAGSQVECVSARTQLVMHRGYELPESQQRDLELLGRLVED